MRFVFAAVNVCLQGILGVIHSSLCIKYI